VTTTRAGGLGNVDANRDGRAVPAPNSTMEHAERLMRPRSMRSARRKAGEKM